MFADSVKSFKLNSPLHAHSHTPVFRVNVHI